MPQLVQLLKRRVYQSLSSPAWWRSQLRGVVTGLAISLLLLYVFQRHLLYAIRDEMPRDDYVRIASVIAGGRATVLAPFDALVVEPPVGVAAAGTVLLFHGNGGTALQRSELALVFGQRGYRSVLAEYPGYAARKGPPTEDALVADGLALYRVIREKYGSQPIVLMGESLGTGVAAQVAARAEAPDRLVLITPYLSIAETAARKFWMLPVKPFVKDVYDAEAALSLYKGPLAILVAGNDELVGASQGRELAAQARHRCEGQAMARAVCFQYVELPQAGHNTWRRDITDKDWTVLLGK